MVRVNQLGSNIGVVVGSACVWRACVCLWYVRNMFACVHFCFDRHRPYTYLFSRLRNIVRLGHGFVYAGRVTRRVVEWKRRRRWQFRFECRRFVHDPPPTAALETARATSSSHHGVARQPGLLRLPRFAGLENLQLYRSGA